MRLALRALATLTFLLGALMLAGILPAAPPFGHIHMTLGILVVVVAALAVSGAPGPRQGIRRVARFLPLLPLVLGLAILMGKGSSALLWVHALAGLTTVALLEMALSRKARP